MDDLLRQGGEYESLWGFFGLPVGFFGGIILFIIGLRRGKRLALKKINSHQQTNLRHFNSLHKFKKFTELIIRH